MGHEQEDVDISWDRDGREKDGFPEVLNIFMGKM